MRTLHISLTTVLAFVFLGCTTLYVPATNQTHMMENQGEVHVAANIGANGGNIQGGYALTNQFGLVASISGRTTEDEEGERTERHTYGEVGINYFDFGTENVRGEFIAGIGSGTGERGESKGDYTKPFIQINAGFASGFFDTGFSFRTAYISFSNIEGNSGSGSNDSMLFFEPAVFARVGHRNVKFESQLGLAYPVTDASDLAFGYEPLRFSIGVKLIFNRP